MTKATLVPKEPRASKVTPGTPVLRDRKDLSVLKATLALQDPKGIRVFRVSKE